MHWKRETFVGFFRVMSNVEWIWNRPWIFWRNIFGAFNQRCFCHIMPPPHNGGRHIWGVLAYLCWMIQFVSYPFICLRLWNGLKVTKWINNILTKSTKNIFIPFLFSSKLTTPYRVAPVCSLLEAKGSITLVLSSPIKSKVETMLKFASGHLH